MSLPEYSRQPSIPAQEILQPQRQQQQQRQQRQQANRYNTTVAVEVYEHTVLRRVKWFSDLQLAYIWSMNEALQLRDERWSRLHTAFDRFANSMDRRWRINQTGKAVARSRRYEWYLTYEPDVILPVSSE